MLAEPGPDEESSGRQRTSPSRKIRTWGSDGRSRRFHARERSVLGWFVHRAERAVRRCPDSPADRKVDAASGAAG
jgi:hypothetical protein